MTLSSSEARRGSSSEAHGDLDDLVEVGVVGRPHGVRGTFKLHLHNPTSTTLDDIPSDRWCLRDATGVCRRGLVFEGRAGKALLLRLAGVSDRDAAEALRGAILYVSRADLPLDEDEYLYADLIGCRVFEGDRDFGRVTDVFSAGASDVLVIHDASGKERLIPLVDDWIAHVDIGAGRIELENGDAWDFAMEGSDREGA